jgi:hypothetical protein
VRTTIISARTRRWTINPRQSATLSFGRLRYAPPAKRATRSPPRHQTTKQDASPPRTLIDNGSKFGGIPTSLWVRSTGKLNCTRSMCFAALEKVGRDRMIFSVQITRAYPSLSTFGTDQHLRPAMARHRASSHRLTVREFPSRGALHPRA